uniref:Alpha-2-macroglobulin-like n=1 Tax=Lates calcarifer TaxID=8187 RepID=A0A4W6FEE1_LATCA
MQYMVAIPAVLEAGAETKFCASLLQPNETVVMTIILRSQDKNTTLLKQIISEEFHACNHFQVPVVQNQDVQRFEVEVQGDTFYSKKVRKVMIRVYQPMTFIQTDKPMYLPGQTVHFRVVTLDTRFRPASRLDANNNRIGQWLNETSSGKILQLSYSLNSEAHEGPYHVIVSFGEEKIYHSFKVEKYVLPKFDVKIDTSDEVSIEQEEIKAEVCAKYTYGQPVPGSVKVKVCRPLQGYYGPMIITPDNPEGIPEITTPCHKETVQVQIQISYVIGRLSFIDTPKIYNQGSNVEGKVSAKFHYNDTPIPDMVLYLLESDRWLQNLTTDSDGVATFSFSTANFQRDIQFHVNSAPTLGYSVYRTVFYEAGHHRVSVAQLPSPDTKVVSSLEVMKKDKPLTCEREEDIFIQYTVVGEKQGSVDVMYLVLSRGAIVIQGFKQVEVQDTSGGQRQGEVSFKLSVPPEMAPDVQVVAYAILPSENVIAHSADFSTEKCFSHKVSLEFSPSSAVPGEETTMQVMAQPDSLCGVSAVDQSVLIKEPGKTLNADKIFNLLPVSRVSNVPHEVEDPVECIHVRPRRYVMPYPGQEIDDNIFYFSGIFVLALLIPGLAGSAPRVGAYPDAPRIETVRTFFPETWIWDLVEVGETGIKDVSLTVPDTITTWETETFCLSQQGFGLAPRKEIRVFQPFFLELTLPYSIMRGEHFELKATTFNYLTSCIMVSVTPTPSLDYTLTPLSGNEYKSCLCGGERKTLILWSFLGVMNVTVTAEAVASDVSCDNEVVSVPERGRIDVVTRSLIVKAEGTEMTKVHNWLLCPKGEALTEEIDIQLPENVIDGSARASLSVLGDILGRALKNLDGLLQMPYGCGEQNMALLAPNIYILQYLKNTQQLTPAIMEKATNFLTSGYQRQLNYKHYGGAYSTFGSGTGNTWLTAFVLKSFAKAKSFIYIHPQNIEESKTWLESKQRKKKGCFKQLGKLFNNRMKGGVSDEVTLSAYITAAFLEMNMSANDPVVKNSLSCLKESIGDLSNTYTVALMAYVFTLAGDMNTRAVLLQHLDTVALKEGGILRWSQTATEMSASLSVEIASYVLLAKLSASPTAEDLGYTSRIVRWLTGQQNYYGGFSSTQDTVVALQALALYSTLVFSPEGSSTVTVQSPSGQLTFDVNQNNKLLYQEKILQDVTGKYSLEVKGTACAAMQISLHYNIPTPTDVTTVSVEVKPEANFQISLLWLYYRYSGKETTTNMVILDIKMLSGFTPDSDIVSSQLRGALLVDHVEQKEDHVLVYMQELPKDIGINHSLEIIQVLPVQNLKSAVVKIYDYYQPSDQAETEYICPCTAGNNLE